MRKGEGGKVEVRNALFALFGGTTTQRFPEMFIGTGANAGGLGSRFVFSYSEQVMPRWKTPNDSQAIDAARTELRQVVNAFADLQAWEPRMSVVQMTEAGKSLFMEWRRDENLNIDRMRRLLDHVKRFAMILAACQGKEALDEEDMRLALAFGDYQIAISKKLMPPDASSTEQMFENLILQQLERRKVASAAKIQNGIRPERQRRGGFVSYSRAWSALTRTGKVVKAGLISKQQSVYSTREHVANVESSFEKPSTLAAAGN